VLGLATGCDRQSTAEPPGVVLGSFHANALLTRTDCGGGVEAPDSYEFTFVLSTDDASIYWTQNGGALVGNLDDRDATWTARASAQVDPTCTLQRSDSVKATLNDVSTTTDVTGALEYTLSAATGADCQRQTIAGGGTFDNIPCTIGYDFSANRE